MAVLSLVGASRGRPKGLQSTLRTIYDTAEFPLEILIRLDEDDPALPEYLDMDFSFHVGPRLGKGTAQPTNAMAMQAIGDIIMHLSDDQEYITSAWNTRILTVAESFKDAPHAFKVDEGRSQLEHPIVNRAWLNRIGYLYPPELRHLYCDTFIEVLATQAKCYTTIPDVKIQHHKHKYGDNTSHDARIFAREDFQNFVKYKDLINDLALKIAV